MKTMTLYRKDFVKENDITDPFSFHCVSAGIVATVEEAKKIQAIEITIHSAAILNPDDDQ